MRALRPEPHRGDQVAAGVVVLATLVLLLMVRFGDEWGAGVHLAYSAAAAAAVGAMAGLSEREGGSPRAYQSILYVATVALTLVALVALADVLGSQGIGSPGTATWVFLVLTAVAGAFAALRNSAVCTLLGAVAAAVAVLALVEWLLETGAGTARWVLLVLFAVFALGAMGRRDRDRRHAVQLVNAAGLAALAIASSFGLAALFGLFARGFVGFEVGWGWELFLVVCGCGLIAYAAVDREPGPGYLGAAVLLSFALLAAGGDSILGWPLVLAAAAGAMLVIGLRPSAPLPPEPGADDEPPPVTTIRVP